MVIFRLTGYLGKELFAKEWKRTDAGSLLAERPGASPRNEEENPQPRVLTVIDLLPFHPLRASSLGTESEAGAGVVNQAWLLGWGYPAPALEKKEVSVDPDR